MRATVFLFFGLLGILLHPGLSQAQPSEAERLYIEATEAYEAERFPAARELLERSLRAEVSVVAAYNLALVLQSLGLPVEAEAILMRLLDNEFGEPTRGQRRRVRELRNEVHDEQSIIMVTLRGGDGTLELDGDAVAELRDGVEHVRRINPGQRRVTAAGDGGARAGAQVEAVSGRGFEVELFLLEGRGTASEQGAETTEAPQRSRRGLRIGLVLGAVLVAGAVAVGTWALVRPTPYEDPVFPTARVLRF